MADQQELDKAYLDIAVRWSLMSKAIRRKVGCIIVKDQQIISDGFNGTPAGFDNICEEPAISKINESVYDIDPLDLKTKAEVLHAESNALMKLARSTNSSVGATMYLTCAPCFDCAKLIIQSGISRLVYLDSYRSYSGLLLLEKAGIVVEQSTSSSAG